MKIWHTFGAFGDAVVEITWRELLTLAWGKDLPLRGTSVIVSLGKAQAKSLGSAASREDQLGRERIFQPERVSNE